MVKNKYCLEHNIPLYRITYDYRDKIPEAFEKLEEFRVKEENHYHLDVA
jgi:hypothetical protein